ncbi:hypothetical protein [uncultured Duncaniella sp.]|jgi:hypothetical protein|uniref:hypothetical protein n=1 Tax=uncultured Duncaniella sp. TaxID=2768039 RepID=UPI0025B09915|nr:hypothetical protein [uncultured Duncaniella sp.]
MMEIDIDIEYTGFEVRGRNKKPRPVMRSDTIKAEIQEVFGSDAPEVMVIEPYKERPMSVRHYKGEFYKEARLSYCRGAETIEYEFSEIPWKRYLTPDFMARSKSKKEVVGYVKTASDQFLIVDNVAYIKCGEPCYIIHTFGVNGCGTGIFLYFFTKRGDFSVYSALDYADCVKDAVRIAEMRGDKQCIPGLLGNEHVKINVLHPEVCKMKSAPYKFD